jgi:hypothetical protein
VVRPAGTVGGDDANLRSSFPAPAPEEVPAPSGADRPPTRRTAPGRAPDDEDVGWGAPGADSNDDRLARDRPPHW